MPTASRLLSTCLLLLTACSTASAQDWPPWADDFRGFRHVPTWEERGRPLPRQQRQPREAGGDIRDGGPRPDIQPKAAPIVPFPHTHPANSIVIDTGGRKLYYVLSDNRAYAYPISVGREGFNWSGNETVSRKQAWPDWNPPAEMRERDPSLPEKMTGGTKNPLGAIALYLGNTLYRIHGTNDVKSIGQAQSSGCFRMLNSAVLHLASMTEIGTPVAVVSSLPARLEVGRAPHPTPPPNHASVPEMQSVPPTIIRKAAPAVPPISSNYRALREYTLGR